MRCPSCLVCRPFLFLCESITENIVACLVLSARFASRILKREVLSARFARGEREEGTHAGLHTPPPLRFAQYFSPFSFIIIFFIGQPAYLQPFACAAVLPHLEQVLPADFFAAFFIGVISSSPFSCGTCPRLRVRLRWLASGAFLLSSPYGCSRRSSSWSCPS